MYSNKSEYFEAVVAVVIIVGGDKCHMEYKNVKYIHIFTTYNVDMHATHLRLAADENLFVSLGV